MYKVEVVQTTPEALIKYKDFYTLDLVKADPDSLRTMLEFLARIEPVKIFNLNENLYFLLKQLRTPYPVVVFVDSKLKSKTSKTDKVILPYGIFEWYFYYLKKGVFSKKLEGSLRSLKYTSEPWNSD